MKNTIKHIPLKTAEFLETFQPKLKRSRTEPRAKIKRLLRHALPFQDQETMGEIHKKFSV